MKKLIFSILILLISIFFYGMIDSEFKIIESKNTLDTQNLLLDINRASKGDMLKSGISQSYVDKILEYRDIVGGYRKLDELTRIPGIGKKTYEKLKLKFKKPQEVKLNRFNINKVDDITLTYYGFIKKEVQNIRKYQKNSIIRNNLELKKIISVKKYEDLKDYIDY